MAVAHISIAWLLLRLVAVVIAQDVSCSSQFIVSGTEVSALLRNCTEIGGLLLTGSVNNETLSLMPFMTVGTLTISEANLLQTLDGLSVRLVTGTLTIKQNLALINLGGLENLSNIGGSLFILANPNLTNITALTSLISVNNVTIVNNTALCDPLPLIWTSILPAETSATIANNAFCSNDLPLTIMVAVLGGITATVVIVCLFGDYRKWKKSKEGEADGSNKPLLGDGSSQL